MHYWQNTDANYAFVLCSNFIKVLSNQDIEIIMPLAIGAKLSITPCPFVHLFCPSIQCLQFSRNRKAVETSNLVAT